MPWCRVGLGWAQVEPVACLPVFDYTIPSFPTLVSWPSKLIAGAGYCRGAGLLQVLWLLKWWLCNTSFIRPLRRSTMPFVWGRIGGVRRCSIPRSAQSRSNSCAPVAARLRSPNRRSVNSFPLLVRILYSSGRPRTRRWNGPPGA